MRRSLSLVALVAASGLVALPVSAQSNVIESGGTTVGAATAALPLFGSTTGACVLSDTPEPYDPTDFTTDTAGTHDIEVYEVVQTIPDTDDSVILVYAGTFDPADACANFLAVGNETPESGLSLDLAAGDYQLVVAGFLGTEDDYAVRVTGPEGSTVTSNRVVADEGGPEAAAFALGVAYPNPVASGTTIPFSLAEAGVARLTVLDALGREVAVLAEGRLAAGPRDAHLDASALPAGTYLVRLQAGGEVRTRSLTVSR